MKILTTLTTLIIFGVACSNKPNTKEPTEDIEEPIEVIYNIPDSVEYTYVNARISPKKFGEEKYRTRSIDIQLKEKYTKDVVKEIARKIKGFEKEHRIFDINFYISPTKDGVPWAKAVFNPELRLSITGSTVEKDAELAKNSSSVKPIEGNFYKKWLGNISSQGEVHIIYQENGKYYYTMECSGCSPNKVKLNKSGNTKLRFDYPNDFNEHYEIESNGNLGFYEGNEKFREAKLVKN